MNKRFVFFFVFVAVILALVPSALSWDTRKVLPVVNAQTFSEAMTGNSTLVSVRFLFVITVPAHYNGSVEFKYSNMVNGTITSRSYVTEMSVIVNAQLVATRRFQTYVEECDVVLPFNTMGGSPGTYNGTLTIVGTSQGPTFSGTTSLLVSFNEPASGDIPLINWRGGILDFLTLSVVVVPFAVAIIFVVRRHRRNRE